MREPVSENDRRVYRLILEGDDASPERASASYTHRLYIGETEYTGRLRELRTFAEEGGIAIVLEATVAARLPLSVEGAPVALDTYLAGARMSAFRGECLRPTPGAATKIVAASSGKRLESKKLAAKTTYDGLEPHVVLNDVLSRARYRNLDIPRVTRPLFRRSAGAVADDSLNQTTPLSEVVEAVRLEADVRVYDDGENVARGFRAASLERPGEVVAEWEVGRHIRRSGDEDGFSYSYAHETRYSEVRCYRVDDSGAVVVLAKAPVWGKVADSDEILYVEVSDDSVDASDSAYDIAYREAHRLSSDAWSLDTLETVMIDERVERGDTVAVTEEVAGTLYRWLVRVAALDKDHLAKRAKYGGALTLARSEAVVRRLPGRARALQTRRVLYGTDPTGSLYAPASWVYVTPQGDLEAYPDAPITQDPQTGEYDFALVL